MPASEQVLARVARLRQEVRELEEAHGIRRAELPAPVVAVEAAWSLVAELGSDLVSVHAANGDYLFASPNSARLLGWAPEELVGRNAYEFFHPEDLARIAADHAGHQGTETTVRYRIQTPTQGWRWVETRSRASVVEGEVRHIVAITRDIQDALQREKEARTRDARDLAARMLDASPTGMLLADPDGRIVRANDAASALFGYEPGQLHGRVVEDLIPPSRRSVHRSQRTAFAAGAGPRRMYAGRDVLALRADGSVVPVTVGLVRLDYDGRSHILAAISDMTARVNAEQELRAAHHALEDKVRERTAQLARSNADLKQFTYAVSRDFVEPLRTVGGFAELLADAYGDRIDDDGRAWLLHIRDGVERMQALMRDLLVFAQVSGGGIASAEVSVDSVLAEVKADLAVQLTETGARIEGPDPDAPAVFADPTFLRQLIQNLVSNSIKFSGEAPPSIRIDVQNSEDGVELQVTDQGMGFSPADAERLFEMFTRGADRSVAGTGAGLAICKRIVERHGGTIRAEGIPGEGASFSAHFPASASPNSAGDDQG